MLFDDSLTLTPGIRFEQVNEHYRDNHSGQVVKNRDQQWLPGITLGYQATPPGSCMPTPRRVCAPHRSLRSSRAGNVARN
ncbi:TonB-dependent receptor [Edwardsiella tarda]